MSGVRLSVTPDLHAIPHSALDYQAFDSNLFLSPEVYSTGGKRMLRIALQSQSKLLGHLTVLLPFQCWCARFGELTTIQGGQGDRAEVMKKTAFGGSFPTIFV